MLTFPAFTDFTSVQFFEVPAKEFKEMIVQTVFAVSDDETRYFMNGVFMEKKENNLIFAATDGRRLAFIKHDFGIAIPDFKGSIVPPKILSIIQRRSSDEGMLSIGVSEKNINRYFQTKEFSKFKAQINNNTDERITPIIKL